MAKVTIDNLASEIDKILAQYEGEIEDNLDEIVTQVGKKGVQALKNSSQAAFDGTGRYAKGWKSQVEKHRLYTLVTIYNSQVPGLPHLLEFGHVLIAGGRTKGMVPGREHIAGVEEELVAEFEREVTSKL